jgi:hypothetical protein
VDENFTLWVEISPVPLSTANAELPTGYNPLADACGDA